MDFQVRAGKYWRGVTPTTRWKAATKEPTEASRVLHPGGVFAGSDSLPSLRFRLLHVHDTMNTVDPGGLPARLGAAGFTGVSVDVHPEGGILRFRATPP
jgi:hypothetical protein